MLAFTTIEFILQNVRSIVRIATRKNASAIFETYIDVTNKMANDEKYNIRSDNTSSVNANCCFIDETILHFNELIAYDVKNGVDENKIFN